MLTELYRTNIFYKLGSNDDSNIDEIESLAKDLNNTCHICDIKFNDGLALYEHIKERHRIIPHGYNKILSDIIGVIEDEKGNSKYIIDESLLICKFIDIHYTANEPIFYSNNLLYKYDYLEGYYKVIYDVEEYIRRELNSLIMNARLENGLISSNKLKSINLDKIIKQIIDLSYLNVDTNTSYIACNNGIININTLEIMEHNPRYFTTKKINANYIADDRELKRKQGEVIKFLCSIMPNADDRDKLLEALALVFIPVQEIQKAIMFIGEGANGKSTLLNFFETMLGKKNVSHVSLHDLEYDRFKVAELDNKLANIFADIKKLELTSTSKLKAIIAGDPITVERKYSHPFDITNLPRLYFSANALPETPDDSISWFRRWIIIKFEQEFNGNADPYLLKKLTKQENLDVLFSIIIRIANRIKREGLKYADLPEDINNIWSNKGSVLEQFINECCEITNNAGDKIPKSKLYQHYVMYCNTNSIKEKLTDQQFSRRIKSLYGLTDDSRKLGGRDSKSVKVWMGIKLKERTISTISTTTLSNLSNNLMNDDISNNNANNDNKLQYEAIPNLNIIFKEPKYNKKSKKVKRSNGTSSTSGTIQSLDESITHKTDSIKIPTWLVINYKGDPNRVFCKVCNESCYPRMDMPLDLWVIEHANLFHKEDLDEEYKEIEVSDTSSNERLYECNICGALYKEEKNYRNHLALLHKKELSKDALGIMLNKDSHNLSDDEHANLALAWDSKGGTADAE
ncbi:MAG: hypothetical protein KatS3mg003_1904 [Candidatus Nitrosocaldaceae archaeon]|nr:MAG: hypothetical protein KatS3mg003_1904 [Candidatus Nitrosocaldaceae archaeon]